MTDLKIKIKDKDIWEHKCGCQLKWKGIRWSHLSYCETHKPDFQKKADKLIGRSNKKRGRRWTKSDHPKRNRDVRR